MLGLDHVVTLPCPGFQPHLGGVNPGAGGGATAGGEAGGGPSAATEVDLGAATQDPNEIQLD